MKPLETASIAETQSPANNPHRKHKYQKVLDGRKQPVRGLWIRNGKFIARITAEDQAGKKEIRWVPLDGAETVSQAQAALRKLLTRREDHTLPMLKRTPKFSAFVEDYFRYFDQVKDAKRPATIEKERSALGLWLQQLGDTRLDRINRSQINSFIAKRQGVGISGRTVNLDVIALRNVLKKAIDDGWLKALPTENLRPLKWTPKKRSLVSAEDLNAICDSAMKESKNGQEFSDYIRLLAYSGGRRNETLRLKWSDVNFELKQLTIGADGLTKNRECRVVDFNSKLETHLRAMITRRAPDSEFLFPSPQRGDRDRSAKTFRETLGLARRASGLAHFSFHDCRHFFISYCVMSGIDYMTIARWVGHKDGGVLIGKVYGHLANEHAQRQAQRLNFEPVIVSEGAA